MERRPPPPHGNAAWRGHGVRAQRFPRKTQARASIGNADRASSGGRGSNASRSGAFGRRSRTKAQASRPWIHALSLLSPFVRLLRRLTTAARPCGTRAAFAATDVAAHDAAKAHITHNAINTVPQHRDWPFSLEKYHSFPYTAISHSSHFFPHERSMQ